MSSFDQIVEPSISSVVSSNVGMGWISRSTCALTSRQSWVTLTSPGVDFGMTTIRDTQSVGPSTGSMIPSDS